MAFSLGEYQDIFLEEADEQLQELNQNLLELEKNPEDLGIINNIFRAAHSLKSSAAFVGLNDLSDLAHKMENLLQGLRDGTMGVTPEVVDIIFKCFDEISGVIDTIAGGEEPTQDLSWIIREIQSVSENAKLGGGAPAAQQQKAAEKKAEKDTSGAPKTSLAMEERRQIREALDRGLRCVEITIFIDETAQMKWVKAQLIISNLGRLGQVVKTIPSIVDLNDDAMDNIFKVLLVTGAGNEEIMRCCNIDLITRVDTKNVNIVKEGDKVLLKMGDAHTHIISEQEVPVPKPNEKAAAEPAPVPKEVKLEQPAKTRRAYEEEHEDEEEVEGVPRIAEQTGDDRKKMLALKTVKVSVDKLDQLLNNVAELVIANSGYYKLYDEIRKISENKGIVNEFKNRMEQMARIAKDLQSGIMKTRMVPIGQVFNRFNRLVRDLKKEFNKDIELIIKGEETELDKKVIDAIGEPLLHLIRNAVDHGVEETEERKALGKSTVAHITLNAYQGGNQIFVEVSDDGRGLNLDKIKKKILDMGLATVEMIGGMDNNDIYSYIFSPGFSTATVITDISGRGVGMNVVKEIVTELNGNVNIETEPGMGTRFVMAFPLTLAIIPAIMVKVRKEMYAIPLSDVIETIKIAPTDITTIEGHEVINLRGEILSLLRLSDFINLESGLKPTQKIPVVVVGFGNRKIGLIVDLLEGKQEIVIKSLEQNYRTVEGLAGASILGDGSICLILDIASMINKVIMEQDRSSSFDRQRFTNIKKVRKDEPKPEPVGAGVTAGRKAAEAEPPAEKTVRQEPVATPVAAKPVKVETARPAAAAQRSETPASTARPLAATAATLEKPAPLPKTAAAATIVKPAAEAEQTPTLSVLTRETGAKSIMMEEPREVLVPEDSAADRPSLRGLDRKLVEKVLEGSEAAGTAAAPADDEAVRDRVHSALEDFKKELRENIKATATTGSPSEHMAAALNVTRSDLDEFQIIANMGAANAAEALSRILDKRIDLSIPEVVIKPTEKIPEYVGNVDSIYIGISMPLVGELKGSLLMILGEEMGFNLIDMLYGTRSRETMHLDEDGESALKELLNIIGSSVVNVVADKTGLIIKPDIPTIVHDYMQSIIDSILVVHNMTNEYTIIMDTAFYFEDDKIIGNFLMLPEAESIKLILDKVRSHARSD